MVVSDHDFTRMETRSSFCCTSQACKEIIEVLSCFFLGWLANLLAFLQRLLV